MNRCGGEMMSASNGVVCPKPRRLGVLNPSFNDHFVPPRFHTKSYQTEAYDSKAGTELLDIIFTKGTNGPDKSNTQLASSPPFFSGSPPSRVSNPVIQDAEFGNVKVGQLTPAFELSSSPSSARKNVGCVRVKFGHKPATVRIEGFNCRGISAVA